ncbi:Gfo/Idh/MocA family protein [Paenibacillus sacheonensis]|uniref:Gfo/Idh/MocA family oxidoreductase n=1 Tax=Paenibacillus sacheonensis TaxID=742054 RepID=A0A7X5C0K7_9BACL|nr:Gfo/Idh/MocA family oxidoreductase [Paenibacillus sacheonensis]MBM7566768.1 putative dehydrogenase [Paenibacillus sacheonensis]NBC71656.1 Gfo/Idh/MocA family oxidoreductase [Paenibacillus sacheonensis]
MKIGLLGVAHMHVYAYVHGLRQLGVEIAGVAEAEENRGRQAAHDFGTHWEQDYEKLLASDIEAVVVCSENALHRELAVAAAHAGKHILCEKPLADSLESAEEIVQAAHRHGVKLMTAFPCRFHPAAAAMKRDVDNGSLGRIRALQGTNRGSMPGGWFIEKAKSGGGAVIDHTVHVVDLMRWIMPGAEITEVYAEIGTRFHKIEADDCGTLVFAFDNGVIASLDPSWSRTKSFPTWGDVTLEIVGSAGVSKVDLFKQNIVVHKDATMKTSWVNWGSDMDAGLVASFVDSIRNDKPVAVTGEDGLEAVRVALAAYESAASGQPVKIIR